MAATIIRAGASVSVSVRCETFTRHPSTELLNVMQQTLRSRGFMVSEYSARWENNGLHLSARCYVANDPKRTDTFEDFEAAADAVIEDLKPLCESVVIG